MARSVTIKPEWIPLLKDKFNVNETLQLISHNKAIFWSWGSSSFTNVANKGLLFMVNGRFFKGKVLIVLDFNDTYTVHLIHKNGNVLETFEMVYFDELVTKIDERIESKGKNT